MKRYDMVGFLDRLRKWLIASELGPRHWRWWR